MQIVWRDPDRRTASVSTEKRQQVPHFKLGLKNRTGIPSKELKLAYSLAHCSSTILYEAQELFGEHINM